MLLAQEGSMSYYRLAVISWLQDKDEVVSSNCKCLFIFSLYPIVFLWRSLSTATRCRRWTWSSPFFVNNCFTVCWEMLNDDWETAGFVSITVYNFLKCLFSLQWPVKFHFKFDTCQLYIASFLYCFCLRPLSFLH